MVIPTPADDRTVGFQPTRVGPPGADAPVRWRVLGDTRPRASCPVSRVIPHTTNVVGRDCNIGLSHVSGAGQPRGLKAAHIPAPTHHRVVRLYFAGVEHSYVYGREGKSRRSSLPKLIPTPTDHRTVGSQPTGMVPPGADRGEDFPGSSGFPVLILDWSRACVDSASVRAVGDGGKTGPNPTDRRKPGSKHHVITDANGTPLAAILTGANRHDVTQLLPLVDAVPPVRGKRGRPRRRPERLYADRAYDSRCSRESLRSRHITPVIAKRGAGHGSGLGVYRWVVERTLAWLHQFRRLRVRYERTDEIHEAFLSIGCSLICFRRLSFLLGFLSPKERTPQYCLSMGDAVRFVCT